MELTNKKVILISPKFYSMQEEIKIALEAQGAVVDYFEDKVYLHDSKYHYVKGIKKLIFRFLEKILNKRENYWKNIIPSFGIYDILIWIDGFSFSPSVINKLVSDNGKIEKILYLYDDTTYYDFSQEFKYFDRIDSFDKKDCEKFKLNYLPLYWVKTKAKLDNLKYDISCIGYCIDERLFAFEQLDKSGVFENKNTFIKLYIAPLSKAGKVKQWLKYFILKKDRKLIRRLLGIDTSRFITREPVPKEQTLRITSESKCVIDVVKKTQVGYTNRSMQTIGNGIKIITTNSSLIEAPFYDPKMIYILDLENINRYEIDEFIESSVVMNENDYLNSLEINEWVKKL